VPIYDYQCKECGHADGLLLKISEAGERQCPACGKEAAFLKQLSTPHFTFADESAAGKEIRKIQAKDAALMERRTLPRKSGNILIR